VRSSYPEVGRSQRPDLVAKKRGAAAAVKQRQPRQSSQNVSRTATTATPLLDQTTTAALPRDHVHLTHGTCRSASFRRVTYDAAQVSVRNYLERSLSEPLGQPKPVDGRRLVAAVGENSMAIDIRLVLLDLPQR